MAIINRQKPLRVQSDAKSNEPTVVEIELEEFLEARKNPTWRSFVSEAKLYRQSLRGDGRSS